MSETIEIRVSAFPDCWETCGTCASDDLEVVEVRVKPGDLVRLYDTLLVLEAVKTELEIAAPATGRVKQVLVVEGDTVGADEVLLIMTSAPP